MFGAAVSLLEGAAVAYPAIGATPPRTGNAHYSIAPFEMFACAAGSIVIRAANDDLFARLCTVIDRLDPVVDPRLRANSGRPKGGRS